MSGYYEQGHNLPPQYHHIHHNARPNPHLHQGRAHTITPGAPYGQGLAINPFPSGTSGNSGLFVQYAEPLMQSNYIDHYDDATMPSDALQASNARARRRQASGDQVKHRRTRSGCFTCRQRRVKCDESHPTCERCRKGNRACIYPDSQVGQKSSRKGRTSSPSGEGASSPEEHDDEKTDQLPTILDEDDDEYAEYEEGFLSKSQDLRDSPRTPGSFLDHSVSPSTEPSSTVPPAVCPPISRKSSLKTSKTSPTTKATLISKPPSSVARDLQFYLNYFQSNITVHHYSLKRDTHNFLKGKFLAWAMKFEPLKYAVAGYAAYFHTLSQPDGRMSTFLHFYNESVTRLRISLTKNEKQGLPIFLTILQLASIEEMLGDWVNLMGHQRAAFEMMTTLFTPQSITKSEFLLKVSLWYVRFDLFVGFQSGGEAVLGRAWYEAVHDCYVQKVRDNPDDLDMKYEERFAWSRLVAKDTNDLFAKAGKGLLSPQEFMAQLPIVKGKLDSLRPNIGAVLTDPTKKVENFPGEPGPEDIVNPFEPNTVWAEPLWTTNFLYLDTFGIEFMYNVSVSMALKQPFDPEAIKLAWKASQLFASLCAYPDAAPGTVIEAGVSFAIATLFLPREPKTIQWIRKTFAKIESLGYIFSEVLRNRMLESMGESPSDWWLPNDEGCPPIIRSIKDFIKERSSVPKDQVADDLREMRGISNTVIISDSPSDAVTVTSTDDSIGRDGVDEEMFGIPE